MERGRLHALLLATGLFASACAPAVGGLVAGSGDSGASTTVVNPTLSVTAPASFVNTTSLSVQAETVPAGMAVEANLDGGGWQRVATPWLMSGLTEGAHTATMRVVEAPESEVTISWTVDTVAPTPPTGLTVEGAAAGTLSISWTAGSDPGSGMQGHSIDYGLTSGLPTEELSIADGVTTATATGLSACQKYYVTVKSVDRAGNESVATAEVAARANCGGDGNFTTSEVLVGDYILEVERGDFNGDGILDLAVSDEQDVKILIGDGSDGRGDGTFTVGESYTFADYVDAIAVHDFDADGIEDLAVISDGDLRIYRGDGASNVGDGTFTLTETIVTSLLTPQCLHVKDITGDGIADIMVGDWGGNRLLVFTGDGSNGRGDGTFTFGSAVTTGNAPGEIASGDFNADGITDLAIACQSSTDVLVTHLGNGSDGVGDGTFAAAQAWLTGGFVAGGVLVADANGDQIDDIVVSLALANAVCFMVGTGSGGQGDGSFYLDEVVGVASQPWGLIRGEFTGDNIVDFATVSYGEAGVTLIESKGANGRGNGLFTTKNIGATGDRIFDGISGDVDGNGSTDICVGFGDGRVLVLANDGQKGVADGSFAARGNEPSAVGNTYGVRAQDVDSDKVPDLMVASFQQPYPGGSEFVLQYLNVASGGLGTGSLPSGQLLFTGSSPTAFAFGDFQSDGITDFAVLCSDLELRGGGNLVDVQIGAGSNGVGTGGAASSSTIAVGTTPRAIVRGDFDEDGIDDLAVANFASNTISILLGDGSGGRGDGSFTAQAPVAAGVGPFTMGTGDFNDDSIVDLAIGTAPTGGGGALRILLGQGSNGAGNGTFSAGETIATSNAVTGLVVGDFNGDGITDVVTTQYRAGGGTAVSGVILFTGDGANSVGDGTFTAGSELAIGGNAYAITAADFDCDRVLDLAVTDFDSAAVAILLGGGGNGRGDGTFGAPDGVALLAPSITIAHGDLDSDGVVDLIAGGGASLSILFGGGSF